MDTIDKTLYAIRCRISEVSSGTQEHLFLTKLAREITLNALKEAEVKNLAQLDVSSMVCDLGRRFHECEIHRCSTYGCLNCGQYKKQT